MENMMPYLNNIQNTNDKDFIDMDTLEHIRSVSECSIGGTSGYNSTTSPGPGNSPNSSGYSPVQSPDSALRAEFSNLAIPKLLPYQQNSPQYTQLQNVSTLSSQQPLYEQTDVMNFPANLNFGNPLNFQQFSQQLGSNKSVKYVYEATLRIAEQPVEKFRFRYKSEMHGTHGSLNGTSSQRSTKTFPEVELCGYKGPAIIRCSLFQTNLESPHSHQLVIRKDDHDICDPHELNVNQADGYFAEFKNMGIIHTAKKFIVEELLKKKRKRLLFELGRDALPMKEEQELVKQTEKEAKDMNLNQVRLCFEAFRLEKNKTYTPIAAPVYSNPINNRKSAQTGELRITRLSIATGNVGGGDDLILLVEKVSKKNIKVRFYEMVDDEQVWEAFASFRESDVHHQYAIVCRTPPYKDKNIEKPVEVYVELVRPSDDERSYPPVSFRYKPSSAVISRKRRRTCSSLTASSCSNSGSLSSGDIPKTVQDQLSMGIDSADLKKMLNDPSFNKSNNMSSELKMNLSGILDLLEDPSMTFNFPQLSGGHTETDGASNRSELKKSYHYKKSMISKKQMDLEAQQQPINSYLQRILKIFDDTVRSMTPKNSIKFKSAAEQIRKIFNEHSEKHRESLIHEIVASENRFARAIFSILEYFELEDLTNSLVNKCSQTALHYCCLYNQPIYIRRLLNLGCNPDVQDNEGNTALHIAVRENHLICIESFINSEKTFNLNIKNDDGFTPLHLAIRDSNLNIVAKLLNYNGDIVSEPYSKDGNNALHMAIQQQNPKLVSLVLNNNPLIPSILCATNTAGQTPLDLAKLLVTSDDQSQTILNLLLPYYNKQTSMEVTTSDEENRDEIIIKEENSCSSTEDDEEDNASNLSSTEFSNDVKNLTTIDLKKEIEIKEEFLDEISIFDINELETALNDTNIYTQLCNKLNQDDKWKKLATEMKMLEFYVTNAEGFLNSLKLNLKDINCNQFAVALENIDKTLINLIRNQ